MGAIIYLLVSGKVPFEGNTDQEIISKIKAGKVDFTGGVWDDISHCAKDLISKLLTLDINKRIGVEDAYEHEWIQTCDCLKEKENTEAESEALRNLKRFNADMKITRAILGFVAKEVFLHEEEQALKKAKKVPKDGNVSKE